MGNLLEENMIFDNNPDNKDEVDINLLDKSDKSSVNLKIQQKKRSHKHVISDDEDDEDYEPTRKSVKTKRKGNEIDEQSTNKSVQPRNRLRNRVTKSNSNPED